MNRSEAITSRLEAIAIRWVQICKSLNCDADCSSGQQKDNLCAGNRHIFFKERSDSILHVTSCP